SLLHFNTILFFLLLLRSQISTLFTYTTLFRSFKIWLSACPICKSPLAYGGPSCNINNGLSLVRFNPWPYTSSFSHFSRRIGSLFGRFPLIGNVVFCICNVGLCSTINFLLIIISTIYFKHKK